MALKKKGWFSRWVKGTKLGVLSNTGIVLPAWLPFVSDFILYKQNLQEINRIIANYTITGVYPGINWELFSNVSPFISILQKSVH